MPVFVVGANFRSAPLELLERLAIDPEHRPKALAGLSDLEHVHEAVVVSTCNRVEIYTAISRFHGAAGDVRRFLADLHGLRLEEFADHLYDYYEERAVQHLFGVAAGIDSMVVGEAQILGQIREAFQAAQAERSVGAVLSALFTRAIKVGRRARSETAIGAGMASTVTVGLRVAAGQLGDLAGRRVLLVGAGSLARLAGRALREAGVGELVVANRTMATGAALARELGGRAVPLDRVADELALADLAVAATAGSTPTVGAATVADALARRDRRGGGPGTPGGSRVGSGPLVLLDLGVPRDVEPGVRGLPGVVLADLDALRAVLETDEEPRREVERVRSLIARETGAFMGGQREARLNPTIRVLRARAEQVRQQELAKMSTRLAGLDDRQRAAVEAVTRGLVNKLLHDPMVRGKTLAARPDGDLYVAALRELYGLDPQPGDDDRR
ncbi:MAG TPA: glutamyl-tRNA reductase [Actinomycetota bacterium]|nr:glutamyl-tRNA reductase [Actinomycetota bacterium]